MREIGNRGKSDVGRRGWRIAFWNIARMRNKDRDFWRGIMEWDVIILMET